MRSLKTLGLAAVAAMAMTAVLGASTASATVLCKNNSNTTTCNERYGVGTEIHIVLVIGTKGKLTTSFKTIECGKTTITIKIGLEGSSTSTVSGNVTALTMEECNCEAKALKNGSVELHHISGTDNGTITSSGAEVTVACSTIFGTVHCIYATSNTDVGTLTGGNPATADISSADIPRLSTSALCDESANWDASYEVTTPKIVFASAG